MNSMEVLLCAKIDGHRIEDGRVVVDYIKRSSEPDVGYYGPVEIAGLESVTGRPLKRIAAKLTQENWDFLESQVAEKLWFT